MEKKELLIGNALTKGASKSKDSFEKTILKTYGDNTRIGYDSCDFEVISTGCLELDIALHYGGILTGKFISIAGNYGTGKSQLCYSLIKNVQKEGRLAAYVDTEGSFNPEWARKNGVDTDKLLYVKAFNLETAGDICVDIARNEEPKYDLIILDSVAGAPTVSEETGEAGDSNIGRRAKVMSTIIPKLNGAVIKHNCWMVLVNHIRTEIGPYPKQYMPGGQMQYYLSSTVIYLNANKKEIEDGFITVTAKIDKNRGPINYKSVEYKLYVDGPVIGFNKPEAIANIIEKNFEELNIIRGGAWYTLPEGLFEGLSGDELRFQGKTKLAEFLSNNPDKALIMENYVKEKLLNG